MARISAVAALVVIGCGALLALAAERPEAEWQPDLASAQRLARQTGRPIFAVLY